jgi:hypothetical protein
MRLFDPMRFEPRYLRRVRDEAGTQDRGDRASRARVDGAQNEEFRQPYRARPPVQTDMNGHETRGPPPKLRAGSECQGANGFSLNAICLMSEASSSTRCGCASHANKKRAAGKIGCGKVFGQSRKNCLGRTRFSGPSAGPRRRLRERVDNAGRERRQHPEEQDQVSQSPFRRWPSWTRTRSSPLAPADDNLSRLNTAPSKAKPTPTRSEI